MTVVKTLSKTAVTPNGGFLFRCSHASNVTKTEMTFAVFMPSPVSVLSEKIPSIFWLSGLTCNDTNFSTKAGPAAFPVADSHGIALIIPDTSPRGAGVLGEDDSYDLGTGAGFYVDASTTKWKTHYNMESYITSELPSVVSAAFPNIDTESVRSVMGHSMGGHGALSLAFKSLLHDDRKPYVSVSAFAPICNPTKCQWGEKAFMEYFGSVDDGKKHDSSCLIQNAGVVGHYDDILIDQGTSDQFLESQLKPEALVDAAKKSGQKVTLNMRKEFDHSYYFIAAFIADHVNFHAKRLLTNQTVKG
uniref:S-formylglutathione hydrolase n=1 Tax=Corethron hystrix TaxID=216773 RepID=A0A7S1FZH8_9STRA|mmetsp:Transcript_4260/g.8245  ORF Transcript_4260/g.8245 Transcript_4260/m.8245 type:complete len:303 (+) Transcript_4260:68-976(+)